MLAASHALRRWAWTSAASATTTATTPAARTTAGPVGLRVVGGVGLARDRRGRLLLPGVECLAQPGGSLRHLARQVATLGGVVRKIVEFHAAAVLEELNELERAIAGPRTRKGSWDRCAGST